MKFLGWMGVCALCWIGVTVVVARSLLGWSAQSEELWLLPLLCLAWFSKAKTEP